MGKVKFHRPPRRTAAKPARAMFLTFFVKLWEVRSHCAVSTPEQCGRDGGQRAAEAGDVVRSVGKMGGGEQAAVDPECEVMQRVHKWNAVGGNAVAGYGHKAQQYPVADQNCDEQRQFVAPSLAEQIESGNDEIADGNARKNSEETHCVQVKEGEAVDHDAEQKQNDGAPDNLQKQLLLRYAARKSRRSRNDSGDSDDEQKRGEDDIGGGATVPLRVKQRPVGRIKIPGIVDQNHERDGEAAEKVEREQTIGRLRQQGQWSI